MLFRSDDDTGLYTRKVNIPFSHTGRKRRINIRGGLHREPLVIPQLDVPLLLQTEPVFSFSVPKPASIFAPALPWSAPSGLYSQRLGLKSVVCLPAMDGVSFERNVLVAELCFSWHQ